MKQIGSLPDKESYEDFTMPRNTSMGLWIAAAAFLVGFGLIWHIWWLVIIGVIAIIGLIIARIFNDNTEYTVIAEDVRRLEAKPKRITI